MCELAYNGVSEKVHSTIIDSIARKCFKTNIPLKKTRKHLLSRQKQTNKPKNKYIRDENKPEKNH